MGLDELKTEIIGKARGEARRIVGAAQQEADALHARAEADAQRKRAAADAETGHAIEALRQREHAAAALERKKRLMAAKRQVLDEAFAEAERRLAALPAADRRRLLDGLLARAASEIDVARVRCNDKDTTAITGIETVPAEIAGGLIAENGDATLCVDCSFETLLDETREKRLEELARILFPAGA